MPPQIAIFQRGRSEVDIDGEVPQNGQQGRSEKKNSEEIIGYGVPVDGVSVEEWSVMARQPVIPIHQWKDCDQIFHRLDLLTITHRL